MPEMAQFRCPFEMKGREDKSIIEVTLGPDQEDRLQQIKVATEQFHTDLTRVAMSFKLDPSLWGATRDLGSLRECLVPFQSEIVAMDWDYRLYPFLPYHRETADMAVARATFAMSPMRLWEAQAIAHGVHVTHGKPEGPADLARWIATCMGEAQKQHAQGATMAVFGPIGSTDFTDPLYHLVSYGLGQSILLSERMDVSNPKSNRNTFSIVKCPFYPREFGRYSEDVEIVVTREADINKLSGQTRQSIRLLSNQVLQNGGVRIKNPADDKQELGVWIPKTKRW